MPILSSLRPNETPGSSFITRNALMPSARSAASRVANTTYACETPAPVMNRFVPVEDEPVAVALVPRGHGRRVGAGSRPR